MDRFWSKVEKTDTCWLWLGGKTPDGYGRFWLDGRNRPAHRVAYMWLVGEIQSGLQLDHLCRVHNCVRPAHLEPVSQQENIHRGQGLQALNSRKTTCPAGHPYDKSNTYVSAKGHRHCRTCWRERKRRVRGGSHD